LSRTWIYETFGFSFWDVCRKRVWKKRMVGKRAW